MNGDALVKSTTKIMFGDAGISGTAQYMSQLIWILFLKVFDAKEEEWELKKGYVPVIPEGFRFRDWADLRKDDGSKDLANRLTGDKLIQFVNNTLFPFLQGKPVSVNGKEHLFTSDDPKALIVREFMGESQNYMKDGVKLRQLINEIADIDFDDAGTKHDFNDFYETLLKGLQNGGKATGEFYTPRAITKFICDHVDPKIGERVADFACGTGGFLAEAITHLMAQAKSPKDIATIQNSIYGIEWKQLPYMLATTNMLLHDIDNPDIDIVDLMQYVKGPDFPTGGIMQGIDGLKQAYTTGRGKVILKGKTFIDTSKADPRIIITEIPFDVNKSNLLQKMSAQIQAKNVDGVKMIRDETDRSGLRIVIDVLHDFFRSS